MNRCATVENSLRTKRESMVARCGGTSKGKYCPGRGEEVEPGGSFFSASEKGLGWRGREKRRCGLRRREHGGDESGRPRCHKPPIGIALAGMSESSDSTSVKEKGARIGFSPEQPSIAVMEANR